MPQASKIRIDQMGVQNYPNNQKKGVLMSRAKEVKNMRMKVVNK